MIFPYFKEKEPCNRKAVAFDYRVKFHAVRNMNTKRFYTDSNCAGDYCSVHVQKNISKYGAHNQRGEVTV